MGALFKEELGLLSYPTGYKFPTFEQTCFTDMCKSVYYFAIYRPPPSPRKGFTTVEYLWVFDSFVDFVNSLKSKFIIAGDFNVHVDVPTKSDVLWAKLQRFTKGLKQNWHIFILSLNLPAQC